MKISGLTICACWIIYAGYWLASARGLKPTAERQSWSSIAAHRVPLLLGGSLVWFAAFLPRPLSLALTPYSPLTSVLGAVVCALGLFVAIGSRRALGGNWSANVTFKHGHELVETGPYRFVRHPIYTGILLLCLGSVIAIGRLGAWLGLLLLVLGFWIKLKQEESLLLRHFPDTYPSYRKRVKALVPFLV